MLHRYTYTYCLSTCGFTGLQMSGPLVTNIDTVANAPSNTAAVAHTTLREIFPKSYQIKAKSDCIYQFPIDLDPNGSPFGSKSIGKW